MYSKNCQKIVSKDIRIHESQIIIVSAAKSLYYIVRGIKKSYLQEREEGNVGSRFIKIYFSSLAFM